jgi:hypothetical protein
MFPYRRTNAPDELEAVWDELEGLLEGIYAGIADKKDVQSLFEDAKKLLNCLEGHNFRTRGR